MDCASENECCAGADGELIVFERIGEGFFLFDGDVAIFRRIKDFATLLAFNELDVVLAGDNFDDGMFAGDGHGWV